MGILDLIRRINSERIPREISIISKYLHPTRAITLVDVGAHQGDFSRKMKSYYKLAELLCIEPIEELAQHLKTYFNKQGMFVFQCVLSNTDGEDLTLQLNQYAETSSILSIKSHLPELSAIDTKISSERQVRARTLDSVVQEVNLNTIDLLKIDVQGFELFVLKGATNSLLRTRFVWVEISFKPLYEGSPVFNDVYQFMADCGFLLLEVSPGFRSPTHELLQADLLFVNKTNSLHC